MNSYEESSESSQNRDDVDIEKVYNGPELAQEDLLASGFGKFDEIEHLKSTKHQTSPQKNFFRFDSENESPIKNSLPNQSSQNKVFANPSSNHSSLTKITRVLELKDSPNPRVHNFE